MLINCLRVFSGLLRKGVNLHQNLVLLALPILFSFHSLAQSYDYPVKPGTKEWKALQTHMEMISASEIPAEVLARMNTRDLIKTCINYPLALDYLAFDNYKDGYEKTFYGFNGFKELLKRKDAGLEFIKYLLADNLADIASSNAPSDRGRFIFKSTLVELMVTDKAILSSMSQEDASVLLKNLKGRFRQKEINNKDFGDFGKYISAYALSQVLLRMDKLDASASPELLEFATSMRLKNAKVLDDIIGISEKVSQ